MNTDETLQVFRAKIISGEISEREVARFVELLNEALADALINCAKEYSFDIAARTALALICDRGTRH